MSQFPRLDILLAVQRALWPRLAEVSRDSFVLYGGTAVALYLGHRESVDFDFFTHRAFLPDTLIEHYTFLRDANCHHRGHDRWRQDLLLRRTHIRSAGTAAQNTRRSDARGIAP